MKPSGMLYLRSMQLRYPELKTKWDRVYHNGYNLDELFASEDYNANAEKAEATRSSSGVILRQDQGAYA